MNFYLVTAFSLTIIFPGIITLYLFLKIDRRYYPFVFCLWAGCCNEILSFWLAMHHYNSLVNSNIYVLLESLLLVLFFYTTGLLKKNGLITFFFLLLLVWVGENFWMGNIRANSTYFRVVASLMVVTLSMQLITKTIFTYKGNILKNPEFILCACFIIYFTFKALLQSFAIYAWTRDLNFLSKVYCIMVYINLGVNLLYIPAVLWMPRKVKFISPSSSL